MDRNVTKQQGYSYSLVNIECLPSSDHFNVVMDLDESVEELLPYLAASLAGSTYIHGTGVINWMDAGHIVAIYPGRITITDVKSREEAEEVCRSTFQTIREVRTHRDGIRPVFERRPSVTLLDILRRLPRTNCGLCGCSTCMAFAAKVFRREDVIASCPPMVFEVETYDDFFRQLRENGYETP